MGKRLVKKIPLSYRIAWAIRENNNVRLAIVWAFIAAYLVFVCAFIGIMPSRTRYSLDSERHETWLDTGKFLTKAELAGGDDSTFTDRVRPWAWGGMLIMIVGGVMYIPIAFREEAERVVKGAVRRSRERTGGTKDIPDIDDSDPAKAGTKSTALGALGGFGKFAVKDLALEFLWEVIGKAFRKTVNRGG